VMSFRRALLLVLCGAVACTDTSGGGFVCHDPLAGGLDGGSDPDGGSDGLGGTRTCQRSEPVFVCAVPNARDLVGTPIANGQSVACGALYRGAPLAGLSDAGCRVFARLGIKTVIDLREDSERVAWPEAACVTAAANVVSAPMPIPYNVSPADYVADLNASASIAAAFTALGDPAAYPVYFHCTYGRDRTGVLAAVILSALGASRADILQEYLISQQTVGAAPGSLATVLDEIELRGGIEAVLTAAGVTPSQLAALRARAVVP
jgi:protein tyrosine phosphatase (PTP) superfamily phosphohydrolase (DUF442 family)